MTSYMDATKDQPYKDMIHTRSSPFTPYKNVTKFYNDYIT